MPAVRSITVAIRNDSQQDVMIAYSQLTSGDWANGSPPVPGTVLGGEATIVVNEAHSAFTALGGSMTLTPASGGTVTVTWAWPRGMGVFGTATGLSLYGLALTSIVINGQTVNPQLQVYITDS